MARALPTDDGCTLDTQRNVVNYHQFHNITSTSWERETVYYAIGTPAEVLTRLPQIYADNGTCLN